MLLCGIMNRVWDNKCSNCSPAERHYKSVRQSLCVENGILCEGDLIVPPSTLCRRILKSVHNDVHCGAMAHVAGCSLKLGGQAIVMMWKSLSQSAECPRKSNHEYMADERGHGAGSIWTMVMFLE